MRGRTLRSVALAVLTLVGLTTAGNAEAGALPPAVTGVIDTAVWNGETYTVSGWAVNGARPDDAVEIHVYDTGTAGVVGRSGFQADLPRPDVGGAFGVGAEHGFSISIRLSEGAHRICLFGIDSRPGSANPLLGCRDITIGRAAPIGAVDLIGDGRRTYSMGEQIRVAGWALDPDRPAVPLDVHVYDTPESGGRPVGRAFPSRQSRSDIWRAFPGSGAGTGFDLQADISDIPGRHSICVFAIGVAGGDNTLLECRTIEVVPSAVVGSFDRLDPAYTGVVRADGWAVDLSAPRSAAFVRLYSPDGNFREREFAAGVPRPDVGAAFPGAGAAHGFVNQLVPIFPGDGQRVCLAAGTTELGCRTVDVPNAVCSLTSATVVDNELRLSGTAMQSATNQNPVRIFIWLQPAGGEPVKMYTQWSNGLDITSEYFNPPIEPGVSYTVHIQAEGWNWTPLDQVSRTWCASQEVVTG